MDADVYGPSIPTMLNLSGYPSVSESNALLCSVKLAWCHRLFRFVFNWLMIVVYFIFWWWGVRLA